MSVRGKVGPSYIGFQIFAAKSDKEDELQRYEHVKNPGPGKKSVKTHAHGSKKYSVCEIQNDRCKRESVKNGEITSVYYFFSKSVYES